MRRYLQKCMLSAIIYTVRNEAKMKIADKSGTTVVGKVEKPKS